MSDEEGPNDERQHPADGTENGGGRTSESDSERRSEANSEANGQNGPPGEADRPEEGSVGPADLNEMDLPEGAPEPPDQPDETGRDNVRSMGTQGERRAREELKNFDPDAEGPVPDLATEDGEETTPPEYAISGLSVEPPLVEDQINAYRRQYGWLRTYFRVRSDQYQDLQRSLNQARMGESYDTYLARTATYALVVGVVGAILGSLLTLGLARTGVFEAIEITVPQALRGPTAQYIGENRVLFGGALLSIITALLLGGATYLGLLYYPSATVTTRRQSIDITLPHAIVYMYALSYGGMNLSELVRSLAEAEDTYGEVSREFDTVVRDLDLFGNDLFTALQNLRNITPSDNLEQFLDDLLSVLESGGGATGFLEDEARGYLEEASDAQEDFLETLAILSEVFIVGFVATPLFLVVILVVISLVGGQTIAQLTLLVYAVIPIGMAMFLVLVDTLSEPYVQRGRVAPPDRTADHADEPLDPDEERLAAYRSQRRRDDLLGLLSDPVRVFRNEPLYTLALTVPLAAGIIAVSLLTGTAGIAPAAFIEAPLMNTTLLAVAPLLTIIVPLSVGHELQAARERRLARRFPNTLSILSSANKMGIGLTEGLGLVVRSSSGTIAEELRKVRNDILWNASTSEALLAFGARLHVPQLARTSRLLAEGIRSTGDLSRVLSIAAEDARNRYKLDRARSREMSSYVAIVVIGYLVYLLVVLLLDANYLGPIGETVGEAPAPGMGGTEPPLSLANVPVDVYRTVFLHSALIQGVGSGMLAGKLSDNTILSGLKYSIALVVLALIAFVFV